MIDLIYRIFAPKKPKIDLVWYDGTKPTKERIAELRYKLAVSRGMLIAVHNEWVAEGIQDHGDVNRDEMHKAIKDSAD